MLSIKRLRGGGDYITPNLCLNSETWETKCEPEEEEVNLITFTLKDTTGGIYNMSAESGMTWGEWVNSEYNNNNFYEINGFVKYQQHNNFRNPYITYNDGMYVKSNDVIINNFEYKTKQDSGGAD